jgi:hypothetical protein
VLGFRLRASAGLVGPVAFTLSWLVAQRRQLAYDVANEHISGLAARDADDRHLMTIGFLSLGASTMLFAEELERRLEPSAPAGWGPLLVGAAGAWTVVAGVFTRDRRSNARRDDDPRQSWVNDLHDAASVAAGVTGIAGLVALGARFAHDERWGPLAAPAIGAAGVTAGLTAWFLRDVVRPGNGLVQRVSVTVPLAFMGAVALRMLRRA